MKASCECLSVSFFSIWPPALGSLSVAVFVIFLSVTVNDDTQTLWLSIIDIL